MKDYKILILLILVCFSLGDYKKKYNNNSSLQDKHTIFPDTTSEETNKEDDSKSLPTDANIFLELSKKKVQN